MKYMDIWKPASKPAPHTTRREFPRRVKDWPVEARKLFERIKRELYQHAKKKDWQDKQGLALIAYEAVYGEYSGEWERRIEARENIIHTEDPWKTMLELKSQG